MITDIQTIDGDQKRCPPKEGQHQKNNMQNEYCFLLKQFKTQTGKSLKFTKRYRYLINYKIEFDVQFTT